MRLRDRKTAGKLLADELADYTKRGNVIVLALPRGGVPVAYEIANRLHAPLDLFLVRKLGMPGQEELAMGAVAMGGVRVLNHEVLAYRPVSEAVIEAVTASETRELERRNQAYRGGMPAPRVFSLASGISAVISVVMKPGAMAFTRTLKRPSSSASERVMPIIAAFVAE